MVSSAEGLPNAGSSLEHSTMADILSTIRTNMAEETVRVAMGADNASQVNDAAPDEEDDVLELTSTDLASNAPMEPAAWPAMPVTEPSFIASASSEVPSLLDELSEQVLDKALAAGATDKTETGSAAIDDFDRLLKEISTNQADQADQVQEQRAALLAEDDDLNDVLNAAAASEQVEPASSEAAQGVMYQASAVQVVGGDMQVALPAEVLAMALRPLVQEWLKANLPGVVERLVQAEIAKLSGN